MLPPPPHTHIGSQVEVAWAHWDMANFSSDPRLGGIHVWVGDRQDWVSCVWLLGELWGLGLGADTGLRAQYRFMLCSFPCPGDCDPHQASIILCVKQETPGEERPRATFPAVHLGRKNWATA